MLKGYELNNIDNQEIVELIEKIELRDTYEILLSNFYSEQSVHDKDAKKVSQNISNIDELINALKQLKSSYEEQLTR